MPTREDIQLRRKNCETVRKRLQDISERRDRLYDELKYYEKAYDERRDPIVSRGLEKEIGRLKTEIKDVETELRQKEQEYKAINVLSDSDLLREALCNLNYCEQMDVFQEALKKSFVLA